MIVFAIDVEIVASGLAAMKKCGRGGPLSAYRADE